MAPPSWLSLVCCFAFPITNTLLSPESMWLTLNLHILSNEFDLFQIEGVVGIAILDRDGVKGQILLAILGKDVWAIFICEVFLEDRVLSYLNLVEWNQIESTSRVHSLVALESRSHYIQYGSYTIDKGILTYIQRGILHHPFKHNRWQMLTQWC